MKPRIHNMSSLFTACASGAVALLITVQQASAAERVWTGGGADGSWLTTGNWTGGTVPADSTATDTATFGTSSRYSIYLGTGNRSINALTFNSATSYNINLYDADLTTSRTLTIGALATPGGITVQNGNHTISGAKPGSGTAGTLILGSGTFNVASGSTLTFDSRITANNSGSVYDKTGAGTLVLNANSGGGAGWGFNGTGGGFTVSAGILELAVSGATGNSSNRFTVSSGGTLQLSANGSFGANNGNLTLNGTGAGGVGALYATATTTISDGTASIVLASDSRIGVAADRTLTLNQDITETESFGLEKSGAGTLTLGGTNTYTGDTLVSAGTLLVNGTLAGGAVTVDPNGIIGGDGIIGGTLHFNTGADLVFSPTQTLTVNGATVTFGGFDITNLVGLTNAVAQGTYTLIDGLANVDLTNVSNVGSENAYDLGGGISAYFQEGSLQLVVIPEPRAALLGGLGLLILLRRRRHA